MSEHTTDIVATQKPAGTDAVSVATQKTRKPKPRKTLAEKMANPDAAEIAWRANAEAQYTAALEGGMEDNARGAGTPYRAYELQACNDMDTDLDNLDTKAMRKAMQRKQWAAIEIAAHGRRAKNTQRRERKAAQHAAENTPEFSVATQNSEGPSPDIVETQNKNAVAPVSVVTRKRGRPAKYGHAMSNAARSKEKRIKRDHEAGMICVLLNETLKILRNEVPERADTITRLWADQIELARKILVRERHDIGQYTFGAPPKEG